MTISRPARAAGEAAGRQIERTIWSGVLAGVGLAAFIDEAVFHQLLHWHHFDDKSTLVAAPAETFAATGREHAGRT